MVDRDGQPIEPYWLYYPRHVVFDIDRDRSVARYGNCENVLAWENGETTELEIFAGARIYGISDGYFRPEDVAGHGAFYLASMEAQIWGAPLVAGYLAQKMTGLKFAFLNPPTLDEWQATVKQNWVCDGLRYWTKRNHVASRANSCAGHRPWRGVACLRLPASSP